MPTPTGLSRRCLRQSIKGYGLIDLLTFLPEMSQGTRKSRTACPACGAGSAAAESSGPSGTRVVNPQRVNAPCPEFAQAPKIIELASTFNAVKQLR